MVDPTSMPTCRMRGVDGKAVPAAGSGALSGKEDSLAGEEGAQVGEGRSASIAVSSRMMVLSLPAWFIFRARKALLPRLSRLFAERRSDDVRTAVNKRV